MIEALMVLAVSTSRPSISTPRAATPRTSTASPRSTQPTKVTTPSRANKISKPYKNGSGQEVAHRERSINPIQHWLLFGWIWYSSDNDRCFDKDKKQVSCK